MARVCPAGKGQSTWHAACSRSTLVEVVFAILSTAMFAEPAEAEIKEVVGLIHRSSGSDPE